MTLNNPEKTAGSFCCVTACSLPLVLVQFSALGSDYNSGLFPGDVVEQSNLEPRRPFAPLFGIGDVESGDLLSDTMAHLHGGPAI